MIAVILGVCVIVYVLTFLLLPFYFFFTITSIFCHRFLEKKAYLLVPFVSYLLLLNALFYLNSGFFARDLMPFFFVLYNIMFLIATLNSSIKDYNPSLYAYLSSRLSFSYIHSQIVRLICITLGVIFAFMTFLLFQELNTVLWLLLIGVVGILPFIIACLIKAQFKLSVISEAFNMPSLNASVSEQEELQETALQLKSKKWYEQEKYYPAFLIVFYLSFIFMFDSGDILPWQTPLLRTLSIIVLVLTIIVLFGKKLSFIVAPITFLLILGGVFLTGGTFGVLELVFLTLVTGSSVTNWRVSKL